MFIFSYKPILDFNKYTLNLLVHINIHDFLCFATYGCCHPCFSFILNLLLIEYFHIVFSYSHIVFLNAEIYVPGAQLHINLYDKAVFIEVYNFCKKNFVTNTCINRNNKKTYNRIFLKKGKH